MKIHKSRKAHHIIFILKWCNRGDKWRLALVVGKSRLEKGTCSTHPKQKGQTVILKKNHQDSNLCCVFLVIKSGNLIGFSLDITALLCSPRLASHSLFCLAPRAIKLRKQTTRKQKIQTHALFTIKA